MKSILSIRPFQLVLMAIFVLLALLGLYFFATYKGFGGGTDIGAVVIWGTLPQTAVTNEIAQLTTADKGYGKISYVQKQAASFDADLANAIASGNGPDLILIDQEQLLTESSRIQLIPFSSLPQRTYLNTYLPEDSLYLTSTGTYGIPYMIDPLVLYYNQNILSSAGVATPPNSWEAVTGLAPTLSKAQSNQHLTQSAIPFGTYDNIEDARGIVSLLLLQAGNSITQLYTSGMQSVLAAPASSADGVPPAQSAINFYTQFADPTRTVYSWNNSASSARQAFTSSAAALYVGYASEEPLIAASNPNLSFDMAAIPQPMTATNKVDYGLAYAFAIPKASANTKGAYTAALALSSKDYVGAAAQALSMAPANRGALSVSPTDQFSPVYYPEALIAQGWLSPLPITIDSIFGGMIDSINSKQLTTRDAVAKADQALDASLSSSI